MHSLCVLWFVMQKIDRQPAEPAVCVVFESTKYMYVTVTVKPHLETGGLPAILLSLNEFYRILSVGVSPW